MTYEQFKNLVNDASVTETTNFWSDLFLQPFFAVVFSLFLFVILLSVIINVTDSKTLSYNFLLRGFQFQSDHNVEFPIFMTVVPGALTLITFFVMGVIHLDDDQIKYSTKEVNNLYINYMKEQPNIKIKVDELILEQSEVDNLTTYNSLQTNIFDNAKCENCVKQEIAYKSSQNNEEYTLADVLVSYSLKKGETPYLITKPTLREDVLHLEQGSFYNPILYVPKEQGGILE